MRSFQDGDAENYLQLRQKGGFASSNWTNSHLQRLLAKAVPEGLCLIVDSKTNAIVASAAAEKTDYDDHPELGCLGWVMTDEAYRGRGLGKAVTLLAMQTLAKYGYQQFALLTDDWRLEAIKLYLKLGWKPWLADESMPTRWQNLCGKLNLNYDQLTKYNQGLQPCQN